jgi:hypothetical protein
MTETLLRVAERGDVAQLVERLDLAARSTHCTSTGGVPLTEDEKLIDEALWYARHGDIDEAKYRVSMLSARCDA